MLRVARRCKIGEINFDGGFGNGLGAALLVLLPTTLV